MTMVTMLRPRVACRTVCRKRIAGRVLATVLICFSTAGSLSAETPGGHYRHRGTAPPGAIGRWQLRRGGPLPGYFQPVEIKVPPGALVSLAVDGFFDPAQRTPRRAGMLIGSVYRMRVTHIPHRTGVEVFPSVELIDRIYPPAGRNFQFPIPIELTQNDLELAAGGKFVTRVIYLEDPRRALPAEELRGEQDWFEAAAGDDPLAIADGLGRPVAILRLGGRLPSRAGADRAFLFGSPPLMLFPAPQQVSPRPVVVPENPNNVLLQPNPVPANPNDGPPLQQQPAVAAPVEPLR